MTARVDRGDTVAVEARPGHSVQLRRRGKLDDRGVTFVPDRHHVRNMDRAPRGIERGLEQRGNE